MSCKTGIFYFIIFILSIICLEVMSYIVLSTIPSATFAKLKPEYYPVLKHSSLNEDLLNKHFDNILSLQRQFGDIRELNPYLLYSYRPNLETPSFYSNSFGMLDEEVDMSAGTYRILMLGGSVVAGQMPRNMKMNIDDYLEMFLVDNIPKGYDRVQVLNGGVGGYVSIQENLLFYLLKEKIKPHMVVVLDGANDVDVAYRLMNKVNSRFYDSHHSIRLRNEIENMLLLSNSSSLSSLYNYIKRYFIGTLYSYKLLTKLYGDVRNKRLRSSYSEKPYVINYSSANLSDNLVEQAGRANEIYAKQIKNIANYANSNGIKVVASLQPTIYHKKFLTDNEKINALIADGKEDSVRSDFFLYTYNQLYQSLLNLQKTHGIDVVNVHDVFNDVMIDIYRDDVHFLENANKKIAKNLSVTIKEVLAKDGN